MAEENYLVSRHERKPKRREPRAPTRTLSNRPTRKPCKIDNQSPPHLTANFRGPDLRLRRGLAALAKACGRPDLEAFFGCNRRRMLELRNRSSSTKILQIMPAGWGSVPVANSAGLCSPAWEATEKQINSPTPVPDTAGPLGNFKL